MDQGLLIIIIAVVFVFGIYFLRYILKNLMNKGFDAIENSARKNKNIKKGPEIIRLADMYPDLAARHYQAGTAYEINPILLTSEGVNIQPATNPYIQSDTYEQQGITAEQPGANPYVQPNAGIQSNPYMASGPYMQGNPYMASGPYMQGNPYMAAGPYVQANPYMAAGPYVQGNPYLDPSVQEEYKTMKRERRTKRLKVAAKIFTILGILINIIPFIGFVFMVSPRYRDDTDDFHGIYEKGIFKIVLILIGVSLVTYIVLLISKRILYTAFYPVFTVLLSVLFLIITNNFVSAYREDNLKRFGYEGVSGYIKRAQDACVILVVLSILIFICMLLYNIKGFKWVLWLNLLFGAGAVLFGAIAIGQISNIADGMFYMAGNYFGYSLLVLLYAFAYKENNKPLINGRA